MKFGDKISALKRPEWSDYYLDYDALKAVLEELEELRYASVTAQPPQSYEVPIPPIEPPPPPPPDYVGADHPREEEHEHETRTLSSGSLSAFVSQSFRPRRNHQNQQQQQQRQQHQFQANRFSSGSLSAFLSQSFRPRASAQDHQHHRRDGSRAGESSVGSRHSGSSVGAGGGGGGILASHPESGPFLTRLDAEIEKVVLFFVEQEGAIAERLSRDVRSKQRRYSKAVQQSMNDDQNHSRRQNPTDPSPLQDPPPDTTTATAATSRQEVRALRADLNRVAYRVLYLIQYVEINVTGVRKILKKHDKLMRWNASSHYFDASPASANGDGGGGGEGGQRSNSALNDPYGILHHHHHHRRRHPMGMMKPLLQANTLMALCVTVETAFHDLRHLEEEILTTEIATAATDNNLVTAGMVPNNSDNNDHIGTDGGDHHDRHPDEVPPAAAPASTTTTAAAATTTASGLSASRSVPAFHEVSAADRSSRTPSTISSVKLEQRKKPALASMGAAGGAVGGGIGSGLEHKRNRSLNAMDALVAQHSMVPQHYIDRRNDTILMARIYAAQRRLKRSSQFVDMLAAMANIRPGDDGGDGVLDRMIREEAGQTSFYEDELDDETMTTVPRTSSISNALNLLSTLLYMTNYYIIVPTAGTYAKKLGTNSSMASMLVGMTPIAALVSTLLYSWWTSYSYKSALVFASTCSVVGNVLYLLGMPCHNLTFVLVGRLLNGFGSARSINRRYIADAYSQSERTAASAVFVACGAFGMAAGPAIASVLHIVSEGSKSPWWQQENAPGWFMFFAWSIYLILLIIFFRDPPRRKKKPVPEPVSVAEGTENSGIDTAVTANASRGANDERHPLLGGGEEANGAQEEPPWWKNTPLLTVFYIYFVLKLVLESLLSSTALLTEHYFRWSGSLVGVYMAIQGGLLMPANMVVANLASSYDDRELILGLQIWMLVSCVLIMQFTPHYPLAQYIIGSMSGFLSASMLEGPNMSLLSKIIPKSWSEGFFNVGLLATEFGTLGRAVADVFLAYCGAGGIEYMLNNTFSSLLVITLIGVVLTWRYYGLLQPNDKDD